MLKFMISGLALGALVVSGCKPSGSATTKSLDNFAAGKNLHRNVCEAPSRSIRDERMALAKEVDVAFAGKNAEANKSSLKSALQETLTAVPGEFLLMFAGLNTRFLITDNATKTCSEAFSPSTTSTTDIESCHIFVLDPRSPLLTIILPADSAIIRHDTVKALGLAFSQSLSRVSQGDDKKIKLLEGPAPSQVATERVLTNSFLYDLYLMNNNAIWYNFVKNYFDVQNRAKLAEFLKSGSIDDKLHSDADILSKLSFSSENHKKRLLSLVFAHTWDSFYCNSSAPFNSKQARDAYLGQSSVSEAKAAVALKNTKKVLEDFFPVTFKKFSNAEEFIKARSRLIFEVTNQRGPLQEKSAAGKSNQFQLFDDAAAYVSGWNWFDRPGVERAAMRFSSLPDQYRQMLTMNAAEDEIYSRGARSILRFNGRDLSNPIRQSIFSQPFAGGDHSGDSMFRADAQRLDVMTSQLEGIRTMPLPPELEAYRVPFARQEAKRYDDIMAARRQAGTDTVESHWEVKPSISSTTGAEVAIEKGIPVPKVSASRTAGLEMTVGGSRSTSVGSFVAPDPYTNVRFANFVNNNPQIAVDAARSRSQNSPAIVGGAMPAPAPAARPTIAPAQSAPAPSRPSSGSSNNPPLVPIR